MSGNPYQAPVPNPQTVPGSHPTKTRPTGLMVICIACIIFGGLGLFGSVMGIAGLLFQEQISEFQIRMSPPSQRDMQTQMAEITAANFIPNIILVTCNLFIAPFLLIGGIGVLVKKKWGQKILSRALITAMIFVLLRISLSIFLQIRFFEIMKETLMGQISSSTQGGGPEEATMETIMLTSMYFGLAFGIAMALIHAAFYFWGWRYLKKDSCQEYLNTFAAQ